MVEPPASNQASGSVTGTVVQAGAIQHLTVTSEPTALGNGWVVPRQLPLAVRDFTGRTEYLAALDALLPDDQASDGDTAGAVVISAVDGTGGIGKTTLAVHWAHRVQHRFPDGTLHVNLRGYGPGEPATPGEALDGFLRALGVPAERMPSGVEAQAALFRSLLAGRRVLIVLDNANSADQVRPLLPGSPGCVVVVTSRDRLTGLVITEGASRLTLDLLTELEAVELVRSILGSDRADSAAVQQLVQRCARLPLAVRIAATRAAQPHTTVEEVVAELADKSGPLEALSRDGDERAAVRAVFEWSYNRLDSDHAQLFRLLSSHPGPEFGLHVAAAVANLELRGARSLLDQLTTAHLLEATAAGRYRFHDLLRAYAAELSGRYDNPVSRERSRRALLDWYANTARACDVLAYPAHPRLLEWRLPVRASALSVDDWRAAKRWLETERENLLAILRFTVYSQLDEYTLHIAESMRFMSWLGRWVDMLDVTTMALNAARRSGDRMAETWFQLRCGETLVYLRRWEESLTELSQALMLARELDSQDREALALGDLGWLFVEQHRFQEALPHLHEALLLSREVDSGRLEAVVQGNLSHAYVGLHEYRQALTYGKRELELRRSSGDYTGQPHALHNIARARQGLADHQAAVNLCSEAIALGRIVGEIDITVARPLATMALSLYRLGRITEAIDCWQEAAVLFEGHGRIDEAASAHERVREARRVLDEF